MVHLLFFGLTGGRGDITALEITIVSMRSLFSSLARYGS